MMHGQAQQVSQIHSVKALLPDGWKSDVLFDIDASGNISACRDNIPSDHAAVQPGCIMINSPLIAGMPNVHSHAFQRAMAGLTEVAGAQGDSFWTWRQVMYGFLEKLTPDDVEHIAAQLYVEMLEAGYTSVAEFHYLHHAADGKPYAVPAEMSHRIVQAALSTGIGLTHLPVFYAHSGFNGVPPNAGQQRFIHSVEQFLLLLEDLQHSYQRQPHINFGIAPHSLRAVTPAELTAILSALPQLISNAPVHLHIAEQQQEVLDCLSWSGQRPVAWLLDHYAVDERWCLIHATHVDHDELSRVAHSGAVVGLCPTTEANLGDGVFPALAFHHAGGRFGIGSDSHISVSPVEELRWLEYTQRLQHGARNLLTGAHSSTAAHVYLGALAGGAQATAMNIGRLAVGARADFLVLDTDHPLLYGRSDHAWLDAWVFSGNQNLVRDVYVAGKRLVSDGRHHLRDQVATNYRRCLTRLLQ